MPTKLTPDSTEWALRLASVEGGTSIEQTFRLVKGTKLEVVYATILPAHRERTEADEGPAQDRNDRGPVRSATAGQR